uniref:valine--tRNA ligase n=1 Tax=Lygus hesperus TaxID=30085 RepID=A0A146LKM1_LYGHE
MTLLRTCCVVRSFNRCQSSQSSGSSLKAYSPIIESALYEKWKHRNSWNAQPLDESLPPFTTILPPPNVTGTLHLGHSLSISIGDVICRWHRMQGHEVVWVPGTDHAGIATQAVVERDLQSRNVTRHSLGRDKFVDEVWKWKDLKSRSITGQLSRLGASLDWSREYFTLDELRSDAVTQGLIKLWNAGLVYRSDSLVNWCCHLRSAISDIEVDHLHLEEPTDLALPGYEKPITFGLLDYFAYRLENSDEELVVATTRLETMLGDVAVAVHPDDSRYFDFHGKCVIHPFSRTRIPIVLDESVDPKFGTGVVKVTPAHDSKDFDIARRHGLNMKTVILEDGTMSDDCGEFSGLKRFEARQALRTALDSMGLFRKSERHKMNIPVCSRSGDVIESLLKPQWFVKCGEMAKRAMDAVEKGEMVIEPDKYHKMWFSWLGNIKDWCISRQLWWGHQVPFYRCTDGQRETWVAAENVELALAAASSALSGKISVERDVDVLDTWFSSGILPFSSFGWPNPTSDLKKYYPLSIMVTGHDILFFWVARMTMLGLQLTDSLPFKRVLLHSIVCDHQGRKMSKSLGNIIDPIDVIDGCSLEALNSKIAESCKNGVISPDESKKAQEMNRQLFPNGIPQCGADALRFSLLSQNIKNHYVNFNVNECHGSKLFCNKIWQGHKFAHLWCDKLGILDERNVATPTSSLFVDLWILSRLTAMVSNVTTGLSSSDFSQSTSSLRAFLHGDLCDVYIEAIKPTLIAGDYQAKASCQVLLYCFDVAIRCLAPFMPFVSETLYSSLKNRSHDSLETARYPTGVKFQNDEVEASMDRLLNLVHFIRKLKSENDATHRKAKVFISTEAPDELNDHVDILNALTRSECSFISAGSHKPNALANTLKGAMDLSTEVFIEMELGAVKSKRKSDDERTLKRREKVEAELNKLSNLMSDENYLSKASEKARKAQQNKIFRLQAELERISSK